MTLDIALPQLAAIATNDRATPSLVYRALLSSIRDGLMVPGAKLPNERELAQELNTSRTAVRSALAMMERQGLVSRRVGSGTYPDRRCDLRLRPHGPDQHRQPRGGPSFAEIVEGRLLFEPAMMHLVVSRVAGRGDRRDAAPARTDRSAPDLGGFQGADLRPAPADVRQHQEQVPDADHGQHPRRPPRRAVRRPRHR